MDLLVACIAVLAVLLIAWAVMHRGKCPKPDCKKQCPCPPCPASGAGTIHAASLSAMDEANALVSNFNYWWTNILVNGGMTPQAIAAEPITVAVNGYSYGAAPIHVDASFAKFAEAYTLGFGRVYEAVAGGLMSKAASAIIYKTTERSVSFNQYGDEFDTVMGDLNAMSQAVKNYVSKAVTQ